MTRLTSVLREYAPNKLNDNYMITWRLAWRRFSRHIRRKLAARRKTQPTGKSEHAPVPDSVITADLPAPERPDRRDARSDSATQHPAEEPASLDAWVPHPVASRSHGRGV